MHWESHGIETGDASAPFAAQITFGSKNKRETLHEWPVATLREAQQQADDWLQEYVARLGLGDDRVRAPATMRSRWSRLEKAGALPELPEPSAKYFEALKPIADAISIEDAPDQHVIRPSFGYPTRAKIVRVVAAAKASGIDVAGIRVWPDGSVAAYDSRMIKGSDGAGQPIDDDDDQLSAYDRWAARDNAKVRGDIRGDTPPPRPLKQRRKSTNFE